MAAPRGTWHWREGLAKKRSPETAVAGGVLSVVAGLGIWIAVVVLGVAMNGAPGANPRAVATAFAGAFVLMGGFAIGMGIRQHNRAVSQPEPAWNKPE